MEIKQLFKKYINCVFNDKEDQTFENIVNLTNSDYLMKFEIFDKYNHVWIFSYDKQGDYLKISSNDKKHHIKIRKNKILVVNNFRRYLFDTYDKYLDIFPKLDFFKLIRDEIHPI